MPYISECHLVFTRRFSACAITNLVRADGEVLAEVALFTSTPAHPLRRRYTKYLLDYVIYLANSMARVSTDYVYGWQAPDIA